jgi:hypothetical protein
MPPEQIAAFEELIGDFLLELGYSLFSEPKRKTSLRATRLRTTYLALFEAKHRMKATPLGRFVGLGYIEVEP